MCRWLHLLFMGIFIKPYSRGINIIEIYVLGTCNIVFQDQYLLVSNPMILLVQDSLKQTLGPLLNAGQRESMEQYFHPLNSRNTKILNDNPCWSLYILVRTSLLLNLHTSFDQEQDKHKQFRYLLMESQYFQCHTYSPVYLEVLQLRKVKSTFCS